MIAEAKLNIGTIVYKIRVPLRAREVAEVRALFLEKLGAAFDRSIADLKRQWKTRNKKKEKLDA